jgi:hypothetical protein
MIDTLVGIRDSCGLTQVEIASFKLYRLPTRISCHRDDVQTPVPD